MSFPKFGQIKYFLRPEKIGAKQKIVFTASQIREMACAN